MPREGQSRNAISKMRHSRTKRADSVWLPENKEQTTNNANTHMLSTLGNGRSLGGAASMSSTLENYSLVETAGMSSTLENYSLGGATSMSSTLGGSHSLGGAASISSTFGGSYSLGATFDYSTTNQSLAASASMSSTLGGNYSLGGGAGMSSTLENYSASAAASMPSLPGVGGQSLGGAASMSSTLENYSLVEAAGMSSLPGGVQSFADSTTQSYKPSVEKQKTRTKGKIGPNQKKTATGPAHGNYGKTKNKIHKSRLSNASITANDRPLLRAQFNHSTTDTTEDWSCKHCPFTKRVGKTTKEGKTTSKGFTASWSRKHLTGVGKGTVSLCPNIPKELKATIVAAAPKKK